MKLFKISFISIISILIFHSQLYGINLSCDFKQRINERELNGVKCENVKSDYKVKGKTYHDPICEIIKNGGRNHPFHTWISEVIIKDKDVVIMTERSNLHKGNLTNKEIRKFRKSDEERGLVVKSEVHHYYEYFDEFFNEKKKNDRYIFVIKDSGENNLIYKDMKLYTLFFDNISKQSVLTDYHSDFGVEDGQPQNHTTSYFGKCEVLD